MKNSMKITPEMVRNVASLARLGLTESEVEAFSEELDSILGYMRQLDELDTEHVAPTSHVLPLRCPMREDELAPSSPRDSLLSLAPRREEGFFLVPKILE
jgi:aspartyl-tRNA(Asn)/glutamyl-tRNA(Gln) amidotransferase subunit C